MGKPRRGNFWLQEETDHEEIQERKQSIAEEFQARRDSIAVSEIVPEFAIDTPDIETSKQLGQQTSSADAKPAGGSSTANPDKPTTVEEPNTKLLPADMTSSAAVLGGEALKGSSSVGESLRV